jgi:plasmid stabilization system protein ParE
MPTIEFLDAAEIEAAEAVEWYEREAGLGSDLRHQIEISINRIIKNPNAFPVIYRSNVRRILTNKFPYSIIYRVEEDDTVLVITVFHHSRNPIIWKGRID